MPTFNDKDRRTYQTLCHLSERGVLSLMRDLLYSKYDHEKIVSTPSFVYAFGDIPVAVVAHADTVFKISPSQDNFFYDQERDVIWNPSGMGADDRAGIFAIVQLIKRYHLRPHIIITTGEESGCIGAGKLIASMTKFPEDLKFMIQLDRRNHNDSVFYDCDNKKFEKFINKFGFETDFGSFTDISILAPVWKVAAVNLSIGYINEHRETEHLHVDWMYETIEKTVRILQYVAHHPKMKAFEYIPAENYSILNHYVYSDGLWDYYDEETGEYRYNYNTPPGYEHCDWCHREVPKENVIPVRFEFGLTDMNMCLSCHEKASDRVVWCKECGKAYYLPEMKMKNINYLDYLCEVCRDKKLNGNSGKVQQGFNYLSGPTKMPEYGSVVQGMGAEQSVVSEQRRNVNL